MEFSSAEADYQEAAKKDVANQLTVSFNKQNQGPYFSLWWALDRNWAVPAFTPVDEQISVPPLDNKA